MAVRGTDGEPVARLEVGSAGSATPRQGLSLVHFLALPTPLGRGRCCRTHFLSLRGVETGRSVEAAPGRAGSRVGCRRGRARRGPGITPARGGSGGGGGGGGQAAVPGSQRSRPRRCDRGLGLPPPPSLLPSAAARPAPHAHARAHTRGRAAGAAAARRSASGASERHPARDRGRRRPRLSQRVPATHSLIPRRITPTHGGPL